MKNEYPVTRKMYLSWTLESMAQKKLLIILGVCVALGAGLIYFGVVNEFNLLLILLGAFCIYQGVFSNLVKAGKRYDKRAKEYGQKAWTRVIEFGDEEISVSEGKVSSSLAYTDLEDIWEKKDRILLVFAQKTVLRLYRNAFVDTTWEACLEKINAAQAAAKAAEAEESEEAEASEETEA